MAANFNRFIKAYLLIALCATGTAFAQQAAPTGTPATGPSSDEYASANPGAVVIPKDQFKKDAANIACEGTLCHLFSVTLNKKTFTISTRLGQGNQFPYGSVGGLNGLDGYYGGGYAGYNNNQFGYGVQVTWEKDNCTKTIQVDRSVYEAVTTYMRDLVNHNPKPDDPETYPQFTPAEQTMILFYTTVMELVKGAACN